jgi:hypothetical protein
MRLGSNAFAVSWAKAWRSRIGQLQLVAQPQSGSVQLEDQAELLLQHPFPLLCADHQIHVEGAADGHVWAQPAADCALLAAVVIQALIGEHRLGVFTVGRDRHAERDPRGA